MKISRVLVLVACLAVQGMCPAADEPTASGTNAEAILEREQVTGNWIGVRPLLSDHGIKIFGNFTFDVWGNTTGGIKTGAVYTGLMNFGASVDLEKAVGWKGASLNTTWAWFSGRDASVSIRCGQLTVDSEFLISDYAGLFINSTFGWPPLASMNLPNGGPAFPVGALGARIAWNPVDWFTFQTAAFQGNVFAQNVNLHGFRWELNAQNGWTFFNEAQFRWNHRDEETGLPGQLKPGVWFQSGQSADALDSTTSSGNAGFYLILDQMLYREPCQPSVAGLTKDGKQKITGKDSAKKSDQGLACFGRIGFTPADRNFINLYFDTGLSYKGLIPGRDDDTLGLAFGYAQLSNGARHSLADEGSNPIGAEMVIEFTYQTCVAKWLTVQPDLQYIINPGGATNLNNALVIGARASITF